MRMTRLIFTFFLFSTLFMTSAARATEVPSAGATAEGEVVNAVRYVVGNVPITSIDIENMVRNLNYLRERRGRVSEEAAVEELIRRSIIEMEARRESVIVSDARIENEINRRMRATGIRSRDEFRSVVERQTGMPFEVWIDDMRYQLKRAQIIQIKIEVPLPSENDIETFYRRHRNEVGMEVRYREIAFSPPRSIQEEAEISAKAREVYNRARQSSEAFAHESRSVSNNVSPYRFAGGLRDWVPLDEVAEEDRMIAGMLNNMNPGSTSEVFRDSRTRYVILKLEGRRPVPYERVRDFIRQRLYGENQEEAFSEWIENRKKEINIQEL